MLRNEYLNSPPSKSLVICGIPSLVKFLSVKSIYLIHKSIGSFSTIS